MDSRFRGNDDARPDSRFTGTEIVHQEASRGGSWRWVTAFAETMMIVCYAASCVRTRGPCAVIAMVCSKWAARERSAVTTVH